MEIIIELYPCNESELTFSMFSDLAFCRDCWIGSAKVDWV